MKKQDLIILIKECHKEILLESEQQTYKKLQFIKDSIFNIRKTLRDIDWSEATQNEKSKLIDMLNDLPKIIK
jgi:hypothetical protein